MFHSTSDPSKSRSLRLVPLALPIVVVLLIDAGAAILFGQSLAQSPALSPYQTQPRAEAPAARDGRAPESGKAAFTQEAVQAEQAVQVVPAVQVVQVVLLKNGDLLEATVRRDAHSVFLDYKKGVVTLPREKVACVVNSKIEAYAWQVKRLTPADLDGQFALAEWCLNNRALDCATQQIQYLRELAPNGTPNSSTNRKLTKLERRLSFLSKIRDGNNGASPKVAVGTAKLVSHQTVRRATSDVPTEAVAEFTRQIQPLLLNTCANANCHDRVSPGKMMLTRPLRGTVFSKRLTQRNLASVLEHINFVDPAESNLLRTIEHPHASASKAVFGPEPVDQSRLAKIKSWIETTTGKRLAAEPQDSSEERSVSALAPKKPSHFRQDERMPTSPANPLANAPADLEEIQPTIIPASSSDDPFDPSAFNDSVDR